MSRDYVVDAIDALSGMDDTVGGTFQVCDPNPPTIAELYGAFAAATGTRVVPLPVALRVAKAACAAAVVGNLPDVESETLLYLMHPTEYAGGETWSALAGTAVTPPAFESYVEHLVAYVREHPKRPSEAMA